VQILARELLIAVWQFEVEKFQGLRYAVNIGMAMCGTVHGRFRNCLEVMGRARNLPVAGRHGPNGVQLADRGQS
jgi:hypothetical protein